MKLRHSLLPRRAVSLLVSTALCTSLLAFPAHAEVYTTNPDDSLQYDSKTQTFVQRAESTAIKKELERIGKLSTVEEQYSVCSALCEQHPDVPSANYMLAFLMRYSEPDKNKTLQQLEHVIQISETYQNWAAENPDKLDYTPSGPVASSSAYTKTNIQKAAYEMEADIYLHDLRHQESYVTAMRHSLRVQKADCLRYFSDDLDEQIEVTPEGELAFASYDAALTTREWPFAIGTLRNIDAKEKELDAIEAWYQSGSSKDFTAWNGRVQVSASNPRNMTVYVQCTGNNVAAVQDEFHKDTPVSRILRGLDGVCFMLRPESSSTDSNKQTTWYTDGTTKQSINSGSSVSFGDTFEFCSLQDLDLPPIATEVLKAKYGDEYQTAYQYPETLQYFSISATEGPQGNTLISSSHFSDELWQLY